MNKHAQKQHALKANSDAYARCLMQVAVATDQCRRPAPESLTVRSKSFAHGAYASTMMGDVCAPLASILRCCVCLLRAPRASDHVCTALRGASCASCSTDTPCCQELGLSRHPRAHLSARLPARPSGTPVPAHASHARSCVLHRSTRQRRRPAPEQ